MFIIKVKKILKPFKTNTTWISGEKTTSITIENVLDDEDVMNVVTTENTIVKSCILARKKLVQYYTKTDQSNVFAIATAMGPTLKYQYWKVQGWDDFADDAEMVVNDEWITKYKSYSSGQYSGQQQQQQQDDHCEDDSDSDDDAFDDSQQKIQKTAPSSGGNDNDELTYYVAASTMVASRNKKTSKGKHRAPLSEPLNAETPVPSPVPNDMQDENDDDTTIDELFLLAAGNQFEQEEPVKG
ncbi:hypothetical protein ABG067_007892, partial [Albugo candida]